MIRVLVNSSSSPLQESGVFLKEFLVLVWGSKCEMNCGKSGKSNMEADSLGKRLENSSLQEDANSSR